MNQRSLATVLLRILGLSYLYSSITVLFSSNIMMQVLALNDAYGEEKIGMLPIIVSVVGIQFLFGILLMFFAGGISRILFRENEVICPEPQWTACVLTRTAVPLIGVYFLVQNLPYFFTTSFAWFKEKAVPSGMPPQYGEEMAHGSLIIILSFFLILKSDRICGFLHRKDGEAS